MKLVIMTKSTFFVEEDKILATLFEEGMENLHLCKPNSSPMYSERLLTLLPENYYRRITVHDHFYLKAEYGLAGIHLDQPDAALPEKYKGRFSRTCYAIDQLKAAKKKAEYVFLGKLFKGITNPEDEPAYTLDELKAASRQGLIDKHVYALGGMSLDNIRLAKDLGFGGVVICGDLWNRFDIHNELDYKALIGHFLKLKKATS